MSTTTAPLKTQLPALNRRYLYLRSRIEQERSMMHYDPSLIEQCKDARNAIVVVQNELLHMRRKEEVNPL